MADAPIYKHLTNFVRIYGSAGVTDQRAVHDFMECETSESIRSLQAELSAVVSGRFSIEVFDKTVGVKRRQLHNSYQDWARSMLLWIASYKK